MGRSNEKTGKIMVRSKTIITDEVIQWVESLSEQGFNNILIGQALGIAVTTLSTNTKLKEAIQRGKLKLSEKITSSILETMEANPSTQQLLVKRLCLFNPIIKIKKPTNAKEALGNLAIATKQYVDGLINESQLRTIEVVSNSYTKGYEATELEERITELEENITRSSMEKKPSFQKNSITKKRIVIQTYLH